MDKAGIGYSPEGRFKQRLTDRIHNGLRCYEVIDGEITGLALVLSPAHDEKAMIISEEKRTIGGPVLIPDKMIYRINPITGEEYYIFFSAEVIKKIAIKYQRQLWTREQLFTLVNMYIEGVSIKDISLALKRDEEEVLDKMKKSKESISGLAIALMSQKNKSIKEIGDFLKISRDEIVNIATKMGSKVLPKK